MPEQPDTDAMIAAADAHVGAAYSETFGPVTEYQRAQLRRAYIAGWQERGKRQAASLSPALLAAAMDALSVMECMAAYPTLREDLRAAIRAATGEEPE